jgi:predicted ArsR family transcriptional regulator
MQEAKYRESRLCRLLGNPIVYRIAVLLAENGSQTPAVLAKTAGRSVQTVSGHLAKLRAADVVRYETAGGKTVYWLKHPESIKGVLRALQKAVMDLNRME